jgi:hypothetical protein
MGLLCLLETDVRITEESDGITTLGMCNVVALTSSMVVAIFEKVLFLGLFANDLGKAAINLVRPFLSPYVCLEQHDYHLTYFVKFYICDLHSNFWPFSDFG